MKFELKKPCPRRTLASCTSGSAREFVTWQCDRCTAACTFEAMNWCSKTRTGECGYDDDLPHALDPSGVPRPHGDPRGVFDFVQLKTKTEK